MNAQEIACKFPRSRAQENHCPVQWLGFLLLLLLERERRGWKWRIKQRVRKRGPNMARIPAMGDPGYAPWGTSEGSGGCAEERSLLPVSQAPGPRRLLQGSASGARTVSLWSAKSGRAAENRDTWRGKDGASPGNACFLPPGPRSTDRTGADFKAHICIRRKTTEALRRAANGRPSAASIQIESN